MRYTYPMSRKGFTIVELMTAVALLAIIATVSFLALSRRSASSDVKNAASQVVATLRQAQQSAIQRASSTAWGVRLDNTTSTSPRVLVFASSTYATSSVISSFALPARARYATSSIAAGASKDIVFSIGTGMPVTTSSVVLVGSTGTTTVTITVNAVGVVTVSFADPLVPALARRIHPGAPALT